MWANARAFRSRDDVPRARADELESRRHARDRLREEPGQEGREGGRGGKKKATHAKQGKPTGREYY